MKCPVCGSEVSKKWQPGGNVNSRVAQWECGVCGGMFTRAELRPRPVPKRQEIPADQQDQFRPDAVVD